MTRERLTLDIFRQAADSIHDFLKFTGEVSEKRQSIPVLDTQMWVGMAGEKSQNWLTGSELNQNVPEEREEGADQRPYATVWYKFYKKPVASRLGILNRSAVPEKTKVTTATDEILRRWRNTCANLDREVFEEITREFMDDLNGMGYPKQWRMNALEAALNGYRKIPKEPIHRHGASTAMARKM